MRGRAAMAAIALIAPGCGADGPNQGGDCPLLGSDDPLVVADFAYHPACFSYIDIRELTIRNEDDVAHTFTFDDGSVDVRIEAGSSANVGTLGHDSRTFHCSIHPQMTGEVHAI